MSGERYRTRSIASLLRAGPSIKLGVNFTGRLLASKGKLKLIVTLRLAREALYCALSSPSKWIWKGNSPELIFTETSAQSSAYQPPMLC